MANDDIAVELAGELIIRVHPHRRRRGGDSYYLRHAARADLLRRLGRDEEAAAAYDVARSLTANPVEQAFLDAQHAAVLAPGVD